MGLVPPRLIKPASIPPWPWEDKERNLDVTRLSDIIVFLSRCGVVNADEARAKLDSNLYCSILSEEKKHTVVAGSCEMKEKQTTMCLDNSFPRYEETLVQYEQCSWQIK